MHGSDNSVVVVNDEDVDEVDEVDEVVLSVIVVIGMCDVNCICVVG